MRLLAQIGWVAMGSAIGGLTRWGVANLVGRLAGTAFPWGTLIINVSGSFFLGWFLTSLTERFAGEWGWFDSENLRLLVAVGFTGAFTTFSTFEFEAHGLYRDGESLAGFTYLFLSVFLGLVAVRIGVALGRGV